MESRRSDLGQPDERKYCSAACRRRRVSRTDAALEAAIMDLLGARPGDATICPSEAARALEADEARWRALMEPARRAARRLVAKGEVEITQKGRRVDPSDAKGPIRVRRAPKQA